MERRKTSDFRPEVMKLFDQFVHGAIDRRALLSNAKKYAIGGLSAAMLLNALNPKFAEERQMPPVAWRSMVFSPLLLTTFSVADARHNGLGLFCCNIGQDICWPVRASAKNSGGP